MHAGRTAFDNRVTLTSHILTSESMHANSTTVLWTVCLPSLILIAKVVFTARRYAKRGIRRRRVFVCLCVCVCVCVCVSTDTNVGSRK